MNAFNAGNLSAAANFYDPDAYFMPHGKDCIFGKAGTYMHVRDMPLTNVDFLQICNYSESPEYLSLLTLWQQCTAILSIRRTRA